MRLHVVAPQGGDQAFDASPAAVLERLVNRREPDVGSDLEVVEPDDREIVGHGEALEAGGLQDAERLRVGGGEDCRRGLGEL